MLLADVVFDLWSKFVVCLLAKISHYTYVCACVHDNDIGFSHWSVVNTMHIIIVFTNYSMGM